MTIRTPAMPYFEAGEYVRRVVEGRERWRGVVRWCRRLNDREVDCRVDIDHPAPGEYWGATRHVQRAERAQAEGEQ